MSALVPARLARAVFALLAVYFCGQSSAQAGHWDFRTLAVISDGFEPNGPLVSDAGGNWFGTTRRGGAHGDYGTVYEVYRESGKTKWQYRTIYSFCALSNCLDGASPWTGVVVATDGSLYGTTYAGGSTGKGTFYRLTPTVNEESWSIRTLHNFCSENSVCTDGGEPVGGLTYKGATAGLPYDFSSPLYGTTEFGANSCGLAFQLRTGKGHQYWDEKVLYRFRVENNGCRENVSGWPLFLDSGGNLLGATSCCGDIIYRLSPSAGQRLWKETILYDFADSDAGYPTGGVVEDAAGNLFGVGHGGNFSYDCDPPDSGDVCGTLYEVAADGTERTLYRFCSLEHCADGNYPTGSLALDLAGNIYGVTELSYGQYCCSGTVFEWSGSGFHTLHAFCDPDCSFGAEPTTGPTLDSAGNLIGATSNGASVYRIKPRR
jgi:uncharacterized repeat protein (TIGR03803 family)